MRNPELWERFIKAMASGHRSIDNLHEFGGIGVARATLWRWRTMFPQALSEPGPKPLGGVVGYRDDIPDTLLEGLGNGSVLCTDGWQGFVRVARESEASHVVIPSLAARRKSSKDPLEPQFDADGGKLSLARVNALHAHLKSFVNSQARGVSTRHLQGYLDWTKSLRKPALEACQVVLTERSQRQLASSLAAQRE